MGGGSQASGMFKLGRSGTVEVHGHASWLKLLSQDSSPFYSFSGYHQISLGQDLKLQFLQFLWDLLLQPLLIFLSQVHVQLEISFTNYLHHQCWMLRGEERPTWVLVKDKYGFHFLPLHSTSIFFPTTSPGDFNHSARCT